MTCNGTCIRYKVSSSGNKHYELGHKRCSTCEIFIKWDGLHCPCCNAILRTRPKSTYGRYQLLLVRQSTKNRWSVKLQLNEFKSYVMLWSFGIKIIKRWKYEIINLVESKKCKICDLKLSSEAFLKRHYKTTHKNEQSEYGWRLLHQKQISEK